MIPVINAGAFDKCSKKFWEVTQRLEIYICVYYTKFILLSLVEYRLYLSKNRLICIYPLDAEGF